MPAVPAPAIAIACSYGRDAGAVDVLHREDVDARFADDLLLALVEIADADQHGVLGRHLRREAADARELRRLRSEQRGERHAVDVAAAGGRRRVHVAVRVHPDQAERLLVAPDEVRRGRDRSGGEGVVAAEHERNAPFLEDRERRLVEPLADARDLADVSSCSDRPNAFISGIGATRSPASTTGMPSAVAARRGRRCGTPTGPCRRRGGCRRDPAKRR